MSLKLKRIAKPHEVIYRCRGKSESEMKVELLIGSDLDRRAQMQQILRTSTLGKVTAVFDKGVPSLSDLPIYEETRLTRQIAPRAFGWP